MTATVHRLNTGPEIRLGVDVDRVVNQAVSALRADVDLYVRGGALTRVIPTDGTELPSLVKRQVGAPVMRRVTPEWVRERLSLHARFSTTKTVGRGDKREVVDVACQPPPWLALHVLKREQWPGYRPLVGVATAPTLRRDGSVLQQPGYDAASGLLYVPNGVFPPVKDSPTRDEATAARDLLLGVVDDFETDHLGRAWWLALLFTLVARDLVDGCVPAFAVNAPVPGAGKGLFCRSAHRIVFGTDPAHMSLPEDDAEMRKQIATTLLAGDPAVLIDNVSVPIGGDSLDAVITAPVWKMRLLGKNEDSGAIAPRLVWMLNGNGLELVGDLGRRVLRAQLLPTRETPEDRTNYKHPERRGVDTLLAWVDDNRPRLVHAALTCLRAWVVDGARPTVPQLGSFESWSNTIGSAVAWLDMPDPTAARASRDAMMDPRRGALAALFAAILKYQGHAGVTAKELVGYAYPTEGFPADEDLAAALGVLLPDRPRLDQRAHALGNRLRAARGRIVDVRVGNTAAVSLRLTSEEARGGVLRWRALDPQMVTP